jgi:23S rRNA pseudouridine2605 synthase
MRLQRFLAAAGIASRRAAEKIIAEGRVSVNGVTILVQGTTVGEGDIVCLDGVPVMAQQSLRYILLNKPAGYLCSMSDPEGRPLAVNLLQTTVPERVYNIGRLDQWSSGLLLFTNDGAFAAMIVHPSGGIEKEYEVQSDSPIPPGLPGDFLAGIDIEGIQYRAMRCFLVGDRILRIILVEGRNREIRRVFEHYGVRVRRLVRVRIGILGIAGLDEGHYRELTEAEIQWFMDKKPATSALSEDRYSRNGQPRTPIHDGGAREGES